MGGELEPGDLYFGITFGGLAWMGGEGAEGVGRGDRGLGAEGGGRGVRGRLGEEGGGRGDQKQRREERREKATKRKLILHSIRILNKFRICTGRHSREFILGLFRRQNPPGT